MIKLLKNMRKREVLMALLCAVLVIGQIYFDLTLPDYMTQLTTLIKTPGSTTSDIVNVGLKMLGCTLASALLSIGAGFLAARTASGFSFTVREKLFHHVMNIGSQEMQDACRDIARRLGLDAEFHDSEFLEDKSEATWSEKNDNVLVLDADSMSYADMLKRMSRLSDMNVNVTLGTYSKRIGKIITDREILG